MVLVDTSVWIDHLQHSDPVLVELLGRCLVARHPLVVGELALGTLKDRLVDAPLLASALLTPGTRLWTRDRRLRSAAEEFDVHYA